MRFGVLGPLGVWTADGEPVAIPGAKVRALLAVLLINEARLVSADRLIEDLWGDDPPRRNPLGALSAKVSQLRRALDDAEPGARELVVSRPPGYLLRPADEAVDVQRFQALIGRARETDDAKTQAALFADALALWRGPAFADFADEQFSQTVIARLAEQRLTALEDAAAARLALGEHAVLAGELGELVAAHPLRERLRAAHMRALYGAGRQSEALDSYEELRRQLAAELGLDPSPELAALRQAILTQDLSRRPDRVQPDGRPSRAQPPAPPLPAPLTELIGRESAVAEIGALLDGERLVTLTGPGGVGKTRLAIKVSAGRPGLPDGVWMVELAGVRSGSVTDAVAAALDIRESDRADLGAAVRSRTLLLILDNCEHVIDDVAALAEELLRAAPGLRILATSREPLGLAGEVVWDVPPLEVPGPEADPGVLARYGAVRLFVARTAAAVRGFTLDADNAAAVGLLCRRLDGIPLALELAATRVRALGVQGVVDRLDDRFRLLATGHRGAPPRQRTLVAMIDWSWELLTGPEQTVLRRLAVHADGCTLEAAMSVCGGAGGDGLDVLDLLVRLVDRSLVVMVQTAEGPRYRLLESVAAYCVERLREAGELAATQRRHRDYHLALAERADSLLRGPEQRRWLRRLDAEAANMRAVLDRCLADRAAVAGLRLVNALSWYWFLRGRLTEARRSLHAVLSIAEGTADIPDTEGGAALTGNARIWLAGMARLQGDVGHRDDAAGAAMQAADLPEPGRGRAAWFLIHTGLGYGDLDAAEKLLAHALDAARAEHDRWTEAATLMSRANLAHARSDLAVLERDAARSARLFTELGDRWGQMAATEWLAGLAEMTGDRARATRLHRDALRLAEELGMWPEVATRLCWLGWIHTQLNEHPAALEYGAQALRLAAEQGYRTGEIFAEIVLGYASRRNGDLDAAESHLRHLLETAPPGGRSAARPGGEYDVPSVHVPMVLAELGFIAELRGDADAALRLHLEAFDAAGRLGAPGDKAGALEGLAGALALAGDHTRAAEVLGAASAAREAISQPPAPAEQADLDRITATCRAGLGAETFAAAIARGARLTPDTARTVSVRPG